jgi:hypothetical protein
MRGVVGSNRGTAKRFKKFLHLWKGNLHEEFFDFHDARIGDLPFVVWSVASTQKGTKTGKQN